MSQLPDSLSPRPAHHSSERSIAPSPWLALGIVRLVRTAALSTLIVGLLAACAEGKSDTKDKAESPGSALSTDTAVEGKGGSVMMALKGALPEDDEVRVWLEVVPLPAESASLSADVKALGEAFELRSDRPVRASPATPFFLGLPVPEGADRDQLGIAVLDADTMFAPPEGVDVSGLKREWTYLDAVVDAKSNLVIAPLLGLTPEPMIAVVVESEAFDSRPSSARSSVTGAAFEGTCGPGFASAVETCTTAHRSAAASALEDAHNTLALLGFTHEPHLQRAIGSLDINYLGGLRWSISYVPGPYQIQLRPDSVETSGGMYSTSSGQIWIAIGTVGVTENRRSTVRHEYVHATQYTGFDGFPSTAAWQASRWVIEGQAVVSQASYTALERDNHDPRVVDTTLERSRWDGSNWRPLPSSEYMAQDFWWYLLQRFDADIAMLQPFIDRGLATDDVHVTLLTEYPDDFGSSSGSPGGLPQAYWDWVKNQVFEKGVDMDDSRFGDTCEFTALAATPSALTYVPYGINDTVDETLPPLTAHVVSVTIPNSDGWSDTLRVTSSGSRYVRATIYRVPDSGGTQGCIGQGDAFVRTVTGNNESQSYYVVIANTSMSNDQSFTVEFDGTAGIDIGTPADGSSVDEGEIAFRANLNGFDASTEVRWTYRRPADGLLWTFLERTASGETTSWTLCDGDYKITAEAMQGWSVVASTSIDLSLDDLGATNPPDDCRPGVTIQEPIDGLSYLADESLTLNADVENTRSAVQGPRYDVEWRIGSLGGPVVATGVDTTLSFAEGEVTLYVTYGVATDSVTFTSVAATNAPPSASITSPADETLYFMGDDGSGVGGDGHTVTFDGTGSSPQEGVLTGTSLTWEYRRTDASGYNWLDAGSGASVDIFFNWASCNFQDYDVRVTATDSQDLSASDTIAVSIQPPIC